MMKLLGTLPSPASKQEVREPMIEIRGSAFRPGSKNVEIPSKFGTFLTLANNMGWVTLRPAAETDQLDPIPIVLYTDIASAGGGGKSMEYHIADETFTKEFKSAKDLLTEQGSKLHSLLYAAAKAVLDIESSSSEHQKFAVNGSIPDIVSLEADATSICLSLNSIQLTGSIPGVLITFPPETDPETVTKKIHGTLFVGPDDQVITTRPHQ